MIRLRNTTGLVVFAVILSVAYYLGGRDSPAGAQSSWAFWVSQPQSSTGSARAVFGVILAVWWVATIGYFIMAVMLKGDSPKSRPGVCGNCGTTRHADGVCSRCGKSLDPAIPGVFDAKPNSFASRLFDPDDVDIADPL